MVNAQNNNIQLYTLYLVACAYYAHVYSAPLRSISGNGVGNGRHHTCQLDPL